MSSTHKLTENDKRLVDKFLTDLQTKSDTEKYPVDYDKLSVIFYGKRNLKALGRFTDKYPEAKRKLVNRSFTVKRHYFLSMQVLHLMLGLLLQRQSTVHDRTSA